MSKSVTRVETAAKELGLDIEIIWFETPVKTAAAATEALGCRVGQIANSLIFEGAQTGRLLLLLVSGAHRVDLNKAAAQIGEPLQRADINRVRAETGFAVGGVAPFGHLSPLPVFFDETLLQYETVWAAGGRAETVFAIAPSVLETATKATRFAPN